MIDRRAGSAGLRHESTLTVKLGEIADLSCITPTAVRLQRRRRRRCPAAIVEAIATDAARTAKSRSCVVVSVPPAADRDLTLIFLRADGETRLVVGVPRDIIRSPRLRARAPHRDRVAEQEYEYLRAADARADYDIACHDIDDDGTNE
jgi:hypothetical protein